METFFLGCHQPDWLRKTDVPLFISRRRLEKRNEPPRARGPVAIDSGGFTELSMHGKWSITVEHYVAEVRRYVDCIGNVRFAAPMDWMTEEAILRKTGKSIEVHQMLTLLNFVELLNAAPDLPWMPVLQGRSWGDFMRHRDMYDAAGVDLTKAPVVGLGSVCRRSGQTLPNAVIATLAAEGVRTHAFGYKLRGLALAKDDLVSSDSLAWSYNARKKPPLTECVGKHEHCNNCLRFALRWRAKVMRLLNQPEGPAGPIEEGPVQNELF